MLDLRCELVVSPELWHGSLLLRSLRCSAHSLPSTVCVHWYGRWAKVWWARFWEKCQKMTIRTGIKSLWAFPLILSSISALRDEWHWFWELQPDSSGVMGLDSCAFYGTLARDEQFISVELETEHTCWEWLFKEGCGLYFGWPATDWNKWSNQPFVTHEQTYICGIIVCSVHRVLLRVTSNRTNYGTLVQVHNVGLLMRVSKKRI